MACLAIDGFGRTALHRAAATAHSPESLAELSETAAHTPAALHARNRAGMTPLLCVRDPRAYAILVESGADATASGANGETTLHLAASEEVPNPAGLASVALSAGARVAAADSLGRTALHLAAGRALYGLLEVLLDGPGGREAATARDRRGLTPAQHCLLQWVSPCSGYLHTADCDSAAASTLLVLFARIRPAAALPPEEPATQAAINAAYATGCSSAVTLLRAHGLLLQRGSAPDGSSEADGESDGCSDHNPQQSSTLVAKPFTQPFARPPGSQRLIERAALDSSAEAADAAAEVLAALVADVPCAPPSARSATQLANFLRPLLRCVPPRMWHCDTCVHCHACVHCHGTPGEGYGPCACMQCPYPSSSEPPPPSPPLPMVAHACLCRLGGMPLSRRAECRGLRGSPSLHTSVRSPKAAPTTPARWHAPFVRPRPPTPASSLAPFGQSPLRLSCAHGC